MKKIKAFIIENSPEIVLISGLFFIIYASFIVNYLFGLYTTGILLCLLGIFLAKFPKDS
jgi:hypothetical protein